MDGWMDGWMDAFAFAGRREVRSRCATQFILLSSRKLLWVLSLDPVAKIGQVDRSIIAARCWPCSLGGSAKRPGGEAGRGEVTCPHTQVVAP